MKNESQTSALQKSVEQAICQYLDDLDGEVPCRLFQTVIAEVERPLIQTVLLHCNNNQSQTASYLNINRSTLRKKLKQYKIEH